MIKNHRSMMNAVVLERTCAAKDLCVSKVPVPEAIPGWVLIKVKGLGINRAELIMRQYEGDAPYITLPIIPGIECAGEIEDPSDSPFSKGDRVIALMGGMGRSFDGSYAEYVLVPAKNVFTVHADLQWDELAAIPETYFTAYGSLFESLRLKNIDSILVRGGTSAAGLAAIRIASHIGCTVAATTRDENKFSLLRTHGAAHTFRDDGSIAEKVRSVFPQGVDKVLDFVGVSVLGDSMRCLSRPGYICVTGVLGQQGFIEHFDPIRDIPNGVYLCSFYSNYPTREAVDGIFSLMKKYTLKPAIAKVFTLHEIGDAHAFVENNNANGKVVVMVNPDN